MRIFGFRECYSLLPDNLKIDTGNRIERSVYRTISSLPLPIINSKLYPDNYYWYSSITKYFKEIGAEYICFTAGLSGIIILPIDMVLQYNKFSGWKGESKKDSITSASNLQKIVRCIFGTSTTPM